MARPRWFARIWLQGGHGIEHYAEFDTDTQLRAFTEAASTGDQEAMLQVTTSGGKTTYLRAGDISAIRVEPHGDSR